MIFTNQPMTENPLETEQEGLFNMKHELKQYAREFARLGGKTKSKAKSAAARRNGCLGGRPKKKTTEG
jgi:hypothetical protein